jgi:hypothetical protein
MENLPWNRKVIENRVGNYCHVVEVSTVLRSENIVAAKRKRIFDWGYNGILESFTIYYLPEEDSEEDSEEEEKIYSFSKFKDYINSNLI